MKNISIPELIESISRINIDSSDKYVLTYPAYVSYFSGRMKFSHDDIVRGVGFVYSWMPRILVISNPAIQYLERASYSFRQSPSDEIARKLFKSAVDVTTGSIIAASKLLHFMFPESYPIYDSHIYRYCWNKKKAHHYQVKIEENYYIYKASLDQLSKEESTTDLTSIISNKVGYSVSKLRAIELSIFEISKRKWAQ